VPAEQPINITRAKNRFDFSKPRTINPAAETMVKAASDAEDQQDSISSDALPDSAATAGPRVPAEIFFSENKTKLFVPGAPGTKRSCQFNRCPTLAATSPAPLGATTTIDTAEPVPYDPLYSGSDEETASEFLF
jgi:hypothetical protein